MSIDMNQKDIEKLIFGIVERETRGLTVKLTVDQMFSAKDQFKSEVVEKIGGDLKKIDLCVHNSNYCEIGDINEQNKYFECRKQRAIQTANFQAQRDVAQAKKDGEIGIEQNRIMTRIAVASLEQEAKLAENERAKPVAISNAELAKVVAEASRASEVANIEANMAARERESELQRQVEMRRKEEQVE